MFTGIVEKVGKIVGLASAGAGGRRLTVAFSGWSDLSLGESVAVDGVCLTAAEVGAGRASFDVVPETLRRTHVTAYAAGRRVNLERSLRPGDRLGGHFVFGHVDADCPVLQSATSGEEVLLRVEVGADGSRLLVPKGSVAVDGVSLTVAELDDRSFTVALVPHTLAQTNLAERRPGEHVHIEYDMLGKWVYRAVETYLKGGKDLLDSLRRSGFIEES